MRNDSYAPHYAISRYSIREFKTGAEPFMVAIIIIIIIKLKQKRTSSTRNIFGLTRRVYVGWCGSSQKMTIGSAYVVYLMLHFLVWESKSCW